MRKLVYLFALVLIPAVLEAGIEQEIVIWFKTNLYFLKWAPWM